jgi:nitrogen regulatory protein P-II 1
MSVFPVSVDREVPFVKLLVAIIQPTKLQAVREALAKIGVTRMTVCDAQGYGRQRGQTQMYRGQEYKTNLLRKLELEIMLNEDFVERAIEAIISVARTGPEGTIGDGKVFIVPVDEVVQIGERLRGPGAV